MMHAQQRFDYFAPIHAGDCIRFQSRIVDFIQRRQGKLKFLIEETDAFNQHGELTTRFRKTIVIRGTGAPE
ncbi:MAG: MaoC family dehydratase N-terminal domain-containing protein [Gammaproteobacteria bacterium]|nr:MaoC family dehydratase N-terminal domain-containing protein [Gammaproteobacteria bacterium]